MSVVTFLWLLKSCIRERAYSRKREKQMRKKWEERKRQEGKLQLPPPLLVSKQSPLDLFVAPFFLVNSANASFSQCWWVNLMYLVRSVVFPKPLRTIIPQTPYGRFPFCHQPQDWWILTDRNVDIMIPSCILILFTVLALLFPCSSFCCSPPWWSYFISLSFYPFVSWS